MDVGLEQKLRKLSSRAFSNTGEAVDLVMIPLLKRYMSIGHDRRFSLTVGIPLDDQRPSKQIRGA